MVYFTTRDLAGIVVFAVLWGILNVLLSQAFFQMFQLPFLCDIIGFSSLVLAVWWVRKFGTAVFVSLIALMINMFLRPTALHFFGFFAASIVFDVLTFFAGYERLFEKRLFGSVVLFVVSVLSAAFAGLVIGAFLMDPVILAKQGGTLVWSGLHAVGGIIGGALGVFLMNAVVARGLIPKRKS